MSSYETMAAGAAQPTVSHEDSPPEFKFVNPGDEVFGQVTRVQFNISTKYGETSVIELNDHRLGPITVWLGNVQLNAGLVQGNNQLGRPLAVGDLVLVRFDSVTPLDGGKTVKNFSINVQSGAAQAAQQAAPVQPAPQQAPQPPAPQPAPPAVPQVPQVPQQQAAQPF